MYVWVRGSGAADTVADVIHGRAGGSFKPPVGTAVDNSADFADRTVNQDAAMDGSATRPAAGMMPPHRAMSLPPIVPPRLRSWRRLPTRHGGRSSGRGSGPVLTSAAA
jgi:hypothetical protein